MKQQAVWRIGIGIMILMMAGNGGKAVGEGGDQQLWTGREMRLIDQPDEIVATLENGLTIILRRHDVAPVATVRFYVRAGSIWEQGYYGAGLSHLFEHLLMGGSTTNHTDVELRNMMMQIGADHNAFTSKDRTMYYLTVPREHIRTAIMILADRVTRPAFPQEEFDREWSVVQRELEMNNALPERQTYNFFNELRYKVHPMRFPVIGHQEILRQVSRQEILDYYQRMYVPDNSIVTVVGDIDVEDMLAAVREEFSGYQRRPAPEIVLPEEPSVTAPRRLVKVFESMQGPAKLWLGFPGFKLQHKDLYAFDTLANILGQGRSSRLYRSLREEKQLVLNIDAWNFTPYYVDGTFLIVCDLSPENVSDAEKAIWEELERVCREGVTEEELARAKRQLEVGHIRQSQTAEQIADNMAQDYQSTSDVHFSDHYVERMSQVTADQVQDMARKYFDRNRQITLVLTPRSLATGSEEKEKTAKAEEGGIRKITLDNGLRVLLKPNRAAPLVNVQMWVVGGLLDESDDNNGISWMMTRASLRGTANHTAREIVEYFDGVGGELTAECGNNTFYYKMEVMPRDLTESLGIFRDVVLTPTFPLEEVQKVRAVQLAMISRLKDSWNDEAGQIFREKFFVHSPYRRGKLGVVETVQALTPEQLSTWHSHCVAGSRAVLTVFGDIDPDAIENIVRESFAGMPHGESFDAGRIAAEPAIEQPRRFYQPTEKKGATVYIGYPGMTITNIEDRYAMDVLTGIVGSVHGWVHEELRGAGLVYYGWFFSFPGLSPGFVAATAQCEPDKAEEVLERIERLIDKAAQGEVTDEEIVRSKSNCINEEVLSKQTNDDAAQSAALDELYGLGYDWSAQYARRIMAVTPEDVRRVAKKYLTRPPTVSIISSQTPEQTVSQNEQKQN
ncbi:MAG: insulinase family protein [Sedimentisphaerales bacterium]|nr:insulinase family protein [Sedimentisphaerales bacterium]